MDFLLSGGDLAWAIGLAAVLGALGGITSDLVDPLKQSGDEISSDLENRITLPHHFRATADEVGTVDFGFAGPMIVGAVAALVAVFAIGVSAPNAAGGAEAANSAGEDPTAAEKSDVVEALEERVPIQNLIPLAIIGGFAGPLVLRTARRRLTQVLEIAVGQASSAGADSARRTVLRELPDADELKDLSPNQRDALAKRLGRKVENAVQTASESALLWEPPTEQNDVPASGPTGSPPAAN